MGAGHRVLVGCLVGCAVLGVTVAALPAVADGCTRTVGGDRQQIHCPPRAYDLHNGAAWRTGWFMQYYDDDRRPVPGVLPVLAPDAPQLTGIPGSQVVVPPSH